MNTRFNSLFSITAAGLILFALLVPCMAKDMESLYLDAVELEESAVTKEDYTEAAKTYELILSSFNVRDNEEMMASVLYSLAAIYHKNLNQSQKAVRILKIITSQLQHTSWAGKAESLLKNIKTSINPFLNIGISGPGAKPLPSDTIAGTGTGSSNAQSAEDNFGFASKENISRVKNVGEIQMVEVVNPKKGFAISYPAEFWEKIDSTSGSPARDIHLILYRVPGENTENIPVTNVVVITKAVVKPFDPFFMAEQYKDELGLDNPSTRIINRQEVIKDNYKGIAFTLKTKVDSQKLTQRWLLIAGKNKGFMVGATIPESFYYTFASEIDSILNSFAVKGL